MTSGRVERPGASIYYEVTGDGPALVFAHGLGGNHLSWWQQVPYFAGRYRCVTFAHRGFAPSRAEDPDPGEFADDLAALLGRVLAARTLPASRLGELKMPVLFITGTEDIVIPPPLVESLAARVPGGKLEVVPEAGHSVYFERAERFNRVVDGFLSG